MSADERAVRDLVTAWHRLTAAGDVDGVLALMAEDVVFLVAGAPPMQGRAAFAAGLRRVLADHRIEASGDVQEVAVSGALAYCWSRLDVRMIGKRDGDAIVRKGDVLSVLRKGRDGRWLLYRDANLLVSSPTA